MKGEPKTELGRRIAAKLKDSAFDKSLWGNGHEDKDPSQSVMAAPGDIVRCDQNSSPLGVFAPSLPVFILGSDIMDLSESGLSSEEFMWKAVLIYMYEGQWSFEYEDESALESFHVFPEQIEEVVVHGANPVLWGGQPWSGKFSKTQGRGSAFDPTLWGPVEDQPIEQTHFRQCLNCGGEDFYEPSSTQRACTNCGWGSSNEWMPDNQFGGHTITKDDPFQIGRVPENALLKEQRDRKERKGAFDPSVWEAQDEPEDQTSLTYDLPSCPNCGSTEISTIPGLDQGNPYRKRCLDCEWVGEDRDLVKTPYSRDWREGAFDRGLWGEDPRPGQHKIVPRVSCPECGGIDTLGPLTDPDQWACMKCGWIGKTEDRDVSLNDDDGDWFEYVEGINRMLESRTAEAVTPGAFSQANPVANCPQCGAEAIVFPNYSVQCPNCERRTDQDGAVSMLPPDSVNALKSYMKQNRTSAFDPTLWGGEEEGREGDQTKWTDASLAKCPECGGRARMKYMDAWCEDCDWKGKVEDINDFDFMLKDIGRTSAFDPTLWGEEEQDNDQQQSLALCPQCGSSDGKTDPIGTYYCLNCNGIDPPFNGSSQMTPDTRGAIERSMRMERSKETAFDRELWGQDPQPDTQHKLYERYQCPECGGKAWTDDQVEADCDRCPWRGPADDALVLRDDDGPTQEIIDLLVDSQHTAAFDPSLWEDGPTQKDMQPEGQDRLQECETEGCSNLSHPMRWGEARCVDCRKKWVADGVYTPIERWSNSEVSAQVPTASQRLAAKTRTWHLNEADKLEEDTSRVIAELSDGWTIRRPMTPQDFHREGQLMSNCVEANYYDSEKDMPDDQAVVSLRDPDNLPRATYVTHWMGRHNSQLDADQWDKVAEYDSNVAGMMEECAGCGRPSASNSAVDGLCADCQKNETSEQRVERRMKEDMLEGQQERAMGLFGNREVSARTVEAEFDPRLWGELDKGNEDQLMIGECPTVGCNNAIEKYMVYCDECRSFINGDRHDGRFPIMRGNVDSWLVDKGMKTAAVSAFDPSLWADEPESDGLDLAPDPYEGHEAVVSYDSIGPEKLRRVASSWSHRGPMLMAPDGSFVVGTPEQDHRDLTRTPEMEAWRTQYQQETGDSIDFDDQGAVIYDPETQQGYVQPPVGYDLMNDRSLDPERRERYRRRWEGLPQDYEERVLQYMRSRSSSPTISRSLSPNQLGLMPIARTADNGLKPTKPDASPHARGPQSLTNAYQSATTYMEALAHLDLVVKSDFDRSLWDEEEEDHNPDQIDLANEPCSRCKGPTRWCPGTFGPGYWWCDDCDVAMYSVSERLEGDQPDRLGAFDPDLWDDRRARPAEGQERAFGSSYACPECGADPSRLIMTLQEDADLSVAQALEGVKRNCIDCGWEGTNAELDNKWEYPRT